MLCADGVLLLPNGVLSAEGVLSLPNGMLNPKISLQSSVSSATPVVIISIITMAIIVVVIIIVVTIIIISTADSAAAASVHPYVHLDTVPYCPRQPTCRSDENRFRNVPQKIGHPALESGGEFIPLIVPLMIPGM